MGTEDNKTLSREIKEHFLLLKRATYAVASLGLVICIPVISFMWSIRIEQSRIKQDYIKKEEVYRNFVNKGQYIYLEGQRMRNQKNAEEGIDPARLMIEWGQQVQETLDFLYQEPQPPEKDKKHE